MQEQRVSIRGTSDGLIIELGAGDLESVLHELDHRIGQSASFFRGGRVALRVGPRVLNRDEIEALGHNLHEWGVTLWAVESDAAETRAAADSLGLEAGAIAGAPTVARERPVATDDIADETIARAGRLASDGLLVRRTLRSGASVIHRGHVVVIGDVNPGAEVIAGGDVVVWGKLRGLVHAGAGGDEDTIVCALGMSPAQLRIGSRVIVTPRAERGVRAQPQTARVHERTIIIEPWMDGALAQSTEGRSALGRGIYRILGIFRRK
jgi:septum site-determining protein MinC